MVSKILLTLCVVFAAITVSQAQFGPPAAVAAANPWIPKWTPCTTFGHSCVDCNTKKICTIIGGMTRVCTDPTLPYCNLGECSATPSADCAPNPVPVVPATAGVV